MDPLSIVTGCVGLLAAVSQLTGAIRSFSNRFKDASRDLMSVHKELASLRGILDLIQNEVQDISPGVITSTVNIHITNVLSDCNAIILQILEVIAKYDDNSLGRRLRWADHGKGEVERLRENLEDRRGALDFALQTLNL
jgi:regulator of PEP synthase PpsR (kinase-PPPase family)